MRTKNCFRILAFMLLLILPGLVLGQIPQTMSYQGVLTNPEGRVVADGMYTITFNLYTAAKGDQRIWSETQTIEVKNGLFNVALGSGIEIEGNRRRRFRSKRAHATHRIGLQLTCTFGVG